MRAIRNLAALCVLSALLFAAFTANAAEIFRVTLTWAEDAKTTQTISWQTKPGDQNIYVEYGEADTPDADASAIYRATAQTESFFADDGAYNLNSVTIRGLKPGTRYIYRIGDGQRWPGEGSFLTDGAENEFKFLLFGDSQSADYNVWKTTFENAYLANPDARFFVNVGDLVDNGQTNAQWSAWFGAVAAHSGRLPVLPVVGNHETYTPERRFSLPVFFTKQFKLPQNGPEGMKGQAYSLDYGLVHFAVLDSQFGEERQFIPDSLPRQKAWLARDLAATDKPWKIVLMHRPPYHHRMGAASPDANAAQLIPVFEQYGADAVFSGHDHVNARTPKLAGGAISDHGTVYATVGRSGTKTYQTMETKSWDAQFANPLDQPTYTVVCVSERRLEARVFKQNGELLDEWTLTKPEREVEAKNPAAPAGSIHE